MKKDKPQTLLNEKMFQLNIALQRDVQLFPRAYKHVLGNKIADTGLSLLDLIVLASWVSGDEKQDAIKKAKILLKQLMIQARLAHQLTILPHKRYEVLAREIDEIGRMLGGWERWQEKQPEPATVRSVSYTLTSPLIKSYLHHKTNYPQNIIAIKSGTFYKLFFEDAKYFQQQFNYKLRDLAARSSEVKIESCGFPLAVAHKYQALVPSLMLVSSVEKEQP